MKTKPERSQTIGRMHDRLREAGYQMGSITPRLDGTRLEFWHRDGKTIIVHDYITHGFEIYKPACELNDVNATMKAIGA